MDVQDNPVRIAGRAGQIKANIDAAREECKLSPGSAEHRASREQWDELIRQWKQELRELTGEDY